MEQALITLEIVIGACALVLLVLLLIIFVRRRLISASGEAPVAAVRARRENRWRMGVLRLGKETLDWFPLYGLTPRPSYRWRRDTLDLGTLETGLDDPTTGPIDLAVHVGDVVRVRLHAVDDDAGPMNLELALAAKEYTAVRAWVESAPPGPRPVTG